MSAPKKIMIDVVSDVMCPWCYIGKKNLDEAVEQFDGAPIEIAWRPYQLDPTLPKAGKDRQQYLNEKFGGEEKATQIYSRVKDAGSQVGIDFNFADMKVSPNTLDAHRLIRWAGGQGEAVQARLVKRLFEIFFLEGGNIGDDEVLISAARDAGLDGDIVGNLLKTDEDKEAVKQEIAHAQRMGITGVPCFIIDNRFAVMGAQPADALLEAFQQASDAGTNG